MSTVRNGNRLKEEKALFFINDSFPQKIVSGFPIRALLLPKISGRTDTTLIPASPLMVLSGLSLSTLAQLPGADRGTLQVLKALVGTLPCFVLELGTDLSQIPKIIRILLGTKQPRSDRDFEKTTSSLRCSS